MDGLMNYIEEVFGAFIGVIIIILILVVLLYIIQGIFLYKFNKLVFGKGTAMAWIPVFNIYLLGKLTFNKVVGWILVLVLLVTSNYTVNINGFETTYSLLPENINHLLATGYYITILGLFVYAIIKYFKLKKSGSYNTQNQVLAKDENINKKNVKEVKTIKETPQEKATTFEYEPLKPVSLVNEMDNYNMQMASNNMAQGSNEVVENSLQQSNNSQIISDENIETL